MSDPRKETIIDMPDSSDMKAEAIKEVLHHPSRQNSAQTLSKYRTK